MPLPLCPKDILDLSVDPFVFYNLLPGDVQDLSTDWPSIDLGRAGDSALKQPPDEASLDTLALGLMALRGKPLPDSIDWAALAETCARLYARHLRPDGRRPLRMRLARIAFMLHDILDRDRPDETEILAQQAFPQGFVWDWLPLEEGTLIADSRRKNVHHEVGGAVRSSQRLGLPTQIDALPDGRVGIGSCYSDGWYAWKPGEKGHHHPRETAVVMVFPHDGRLSELSSDGTVRAETGAVLAHLPIRKVWCARHIDGRVFASDWSEPGVLFVLDLRSMICDRVSIAPVILTNDICRLGDSYYLVDKMRGRVLAFDLDFHFREARLRFGKGAGRLYDPIAIRAHQGLLHVLSWVTGSLVTIRPF
ncbi:hypothetical protein [Oleispirillum naphthae]|uniref:hypothetical protein n=1 Tax=Oleispirillum naphthae TaxID=2838853 RepID=UPI00308269CE